ncbi:MAG: serine/threonine-protein kinase [Myxococcota bacterium]
MPQIRGYRVGEVVHVGSVSTVYRAIRESDGLPVVLKWLSAPAPTLGDLARYRQAFETMRGIDLPNISKVLALEEHERRPLLVMRDVGGITLASRLSAGPMPVLEVLTLAVAIADALGSLHHHGVVHRDVNPSNIVVVGEAGAIELIDFDLATRLRVERVEAESLRTLSGTLAYISPEQTGRMNRTVDHRTDLYALGATLYEMLAGRVPFPETDSAALIHAHLAVPPRPLEAVAPRVPDAVAAIVMRLLAKAPEDRYQSAPGLRADLMRCLDALRREQPLPLSPGKSGRLASAAGVTASVRSRGRGRAAAGRLRTGGAGAGRARAGRRPVRRREILAGSRALPPHRVAAGALRVG